MDHFAPAEFAIAQAIAVIACAVALFGSWRPRQAVGPILAFTCVAAALPRLPNVGAPLLALAVAAALGLTAGRRRLPFMHALLWLLAAVLAPNPMQNSGFAPATTALLAFLLAVLAVSRGLGQEGPSQPLLAGVLALVPLQNPGLAVRVGPIPLSLEHPLAAVRWGASARGHLAWVDAPTWAARLPQLTTAVLVAAVLAAWACNLRDKTTQIQTLRRLSYGLFAMAIALLLTQIPLALAAQHVQIAGIAVAQPLAHDALPVDWSPLVLGLARIVAVAGLMQPQNGHVPRWLQVCDTHAMYLCALSLFAIWAFTAPASLGSAWLSDPAVYALLAVVAANAALAADFSRQPFFRAWAISALWLGALALLGGADVGAAVASQLLKMP